MRFLTRFLIGFLAVTGAVALATGFLGAEFGRSDYWDKHGILFLLFITLFPRVTLILSSVATGGVLWWLGWIFAPRLLVAALATQAYWYQNPILVVIAWLVALGGESSEKYVVVRQTGFYENEANGKRTKWVRAEVADKD